MSTFVTFVCNWSKLYILLFQFTIWVSTKTISPLILIRSFKILSRSWSRSRSRSSSDSGLGVSLWYMNVQHRLYGHKLSMYIVDYIVYKSFSVDTKLGCQQKEIVSSVCVLGCIYTRTAWCSLYSYDWFIKKIFSWLAHATWCYLCLTISL